MDIITKMNWVDVLVLIIMLRTSYVAFQDGLSHEIIPILGAFSGLVFALANYDKIAYFVFQSIPMPMSILRFLAFVIIFTAVIITFKLARAIFDKIVKVTWHPVIEKFGGLIGGAAKASIITSAILIMLALLPLPYLRWSIMDRSLTGPYFMRIGPELYARASQVFPFVRVDGASFTSQYVVNKIVKDEAQKTTTEKKEEAPDWEWPFIKKQTRENLKI